MESEKISLRRLLPSILILVFLVTATCDVNKDKEKCANDLVGLATCLPYVNGESKSNNPPPDCCSGLKQVLRKSPECICLLVKDRNDPSVGLKINTTLALSLPSQCHAPANISACPDLLHLPPNSPDAKVFEDFANSGKNSTPPAAGNPSSETGTPTTTAADLKSDGGTKKRWLGVEMVCGVFATVVVVHYLPGL